MCYNANGPKSENKGRKLFKELLDQFNITQLSFTENEFDEIDLVFNHKNYKIATEIKVRNRSARTFKTTLLEVQKCKAIKKRMAEEQCQIGWYVNFFDDDLVYIFNIDKHWNDEIEDMYTWKSHDYSYGKTWKKFYKSPVNESLIYQKVDGKWLKLESYDEIKL